MLESMIKIKVIKTKRKETRRRREGRERGRGSALLQMSRRQIAIAVASVATDKYVDHSPHRSSTRTCHKQQHEEHEQQLESGDTSATGHKNGSSMQHN